MRRIRTWALAGMALVVAAGAPVAAAAEVQPEKPGMVESLPPIADHWVFVGDTVLRRSALFDASTGEMLGMVNVGHGVSGARPHISRDREEIYVIETVYDRGHRGTRTDLVTIYGARDLGVIGEVVIPTKRADNGNGVALGTLLGDRFLVVFNQTPATSVSIVDVETRAFVSEIATAGCALVFQAGPRSFGQLCGDGTAQRVDLDGEGRESARVRSERFFDPIEDPVTEKGVRIADGRWLFASFEGHAHEVDFSAERPTVAEPWSLVDEGERDDGWRIGGQQHLALHRASGRLYSVMHRGEPGSHKDGGPEIWVYDLGERRRTAIFEPANLTAAFLRGLAGVTAGSVTDWLMTTLLPAADVSTLAVSQDPEPLLFVGSRDVAGVGVHDALSGEHLRDLDSTGLSGGLLVVP